MNLQEYKEAVEKLNLYSHNYYVLDDPITTDEVYDKLYHEVVDYEEKNPSDWSKQSSQPLQTKRIEDCSGIDPANSRGLHGPDHQAEGTILIHGGIQCQKRFENC